MKISARERILLTICAFLFINIGGFMWVINPLKSKVDQLKISVDEINTNVQNREVIVNALDDVKAENKNLNTTISQIKGQFFNRMFSDKVDEFLYTHIQPFTQTWRSLGISDYDALVLSMQEEDAIMSEYAKSCSAIVEVEGAQRTTMLIIDHLLKLPQVLGVNNISIITEQSGVIKSTFTVDFYHFDLK